MNIQTLKISPNFSFLQKKWPDLAEVATLAETYVYDDPPSSIVKLRIFAEEIVDILYYELGFEKPLNEYNTCNFVDLLQTEDFKKTVPKQVINVFHYIRKEGNKAAHPNKYSFTPKHALSAVETSFNLSQWFYKTVAGSDLKISKFAPPDKSLSRQELIAQKEELEKRLQEFQKQEQEKRAQQKPQKLSEEKIQQLYEKGIKEAETVGFTEEETRKLLIDSMLEEAGWIILDKYDPQLLKPQAVREYPVSHQPTETGNGSIDYVMIGQKGHPIAVIEAKKTSENAKKGQVQAELYASGLKKMTGQRPFIFYTNGHDIFFWDDLIYPPRRVWGFFESEKLEYLLFQRKEKKLLTETKIDVNIVDRPYQLEGVNKVCESFEKNKKRKALIVMATGSGKTRVATAIIDKMMRGDWIKKVLFLVDRDELRKQAVNAFKKYLPNIKTIILSSRTRDDKESRAFIASYPAMMTNDLYLDFNPGFFDLIIADESHRSIYRYYSELFRYFDAFQIGLTATPVDYITRNTFSSFEQENGVPTYNYSYKEAVDNKPPYLVIHKVDNQSTFFITRGIKYDDMTEEQKRDLEEQGEDPRSFNFDRGEVDKVIMNKETNRKILRNLMEKGIRDKTGTRPGKTIVFARSIRHAILLEDLFNEMYPEYSGKVARAVYGDLKRVDSLIDGFKGENIEFAELNIAISVDMLDTGVDVPEVVNLVLAKPIYSRVKFWQIIGRGTRLCENLFGGGKHKEFFLIFDPWKNFEFFGLNPLGHIPTDTISLPERLFRARLDLLEVLMGQPVTTLQNEEIRNFRDDLINLIRQQISKLPEQFVSVRERWRELEEVRNETFWKHFNNDSLRLLRAQIMPLMRWQDMQQEEDAMQFDTKIANLETSFLRRNRDLFDSIKNGIVTDLVRLPKQLNQIKPEVEFINKVENNDWWTDISFNKMEETRKRLRGLMKFKRTYEEQPKIIDIEDAAIGASVGGTQPSSFELEKYKAKFIHVLKDIANSNLSIQKIRKRIPVTEKDIEAIQSLIMERDPGLTLDELKKLYPGKAENLDKLIRSLIGTDESEIKKIFDDFRKNHTTLSSKQLQFLNLLEQELAKGGGIEVARLYEQPFTSVHQFGLDGVFPGNEGDEIAVIIKELAG